MTIGTIDKLAEVGYGKARFLETNPVGFWISSMMAGIYVGFGILLIFSLGSMLDPSVRGLAMGGAFAIALILVVFAGADLYTGHTMSLTISLLERRVGADGLAAVWMTSWLGNLAERPPSGCPFRRGRRRGDHHRLERVHLHGRRVEDEHGRAAPRGARHPVQLAGRARRQSR